MGPDGINAPPRMMEFMFTAVSRAARWGVIALSVVMALSHAGVSTEIVVNGFTVVLASAGLAAAIAFGLGAKERAGKALDGWIDE